MGTFDNRWTGGLPDPPPERADSDDFITGQARLVQRGDESLLRTWSWVQRFAEEAGTIDEQLSDVRNVSRVTVGFAEERDGAFGLIIYTESTDERAPRQDIDRTIRVGGANFPVVVRSVAIEEHWCTAPEVTAPTVARATCWVRSLPRKYEGWLLPKHAVQPWRSMVTFSDGGRGRVLDSLGQCIDVVVVDTNRPRGHSHSPSAASWPIVPGQAALVTSAVHQHVPVTVVDVDLNLGSTRSRLFPIRFSTDWTGVAGQSGALIVDPRWGEPLGMYLGVVTPSGPHQRPSGSRPPRTGYAQAAYQLERLADMEFYL